MTFYRPGRHLLLVVLAVLFPSVAPHKTFAQAAPAAATIRGRVADLQTGEPIAKASVSLTGLGRNAITDNDGKFTLADVPAGSAELRVFTVGYGLLKRRVDLKSGEAAEFDLRLGQEAMRDTQQITVAAGPFDGTVSDAVTQYTLSSSELQDLSTVLANDPFRAVSHLPGVSSNNDFYADFATRGAGTAHIGVYIDGVLVDHPAYSLEDSSDLGSLSAVNGDVARSVSLLSGGFPPSYGNRTAAILDVATRDGARDRVATRFIADVLGAALTSEGPIGKAKKASWLVSGRQSYLAYLLSRLGYSGNLTLNYNDATGKLSYIPSAHHEFSFFSSFGSTSASRSPVNTAGQSASAFTQGGGQHSMSEAHWKWIASPHTLIESQGYWTRDHEHDTNPNAAVDLDTTSDVYGFRADLTHQSGQSNTFAAGVESRSPFQQRNSFTQWNYASKTLQSNLIPFDNYAQWLWEPGAYVLDSVTLRHHVSVTAGGRWAHFGPASQHVWLPHASIAWKAPASTNLTLAFGQYAQMPSFMELYGAFGNPSLRAERSTHETFAVEHFFTERLRIRAELYNRQEHDDVYSPLTEFRLLAGNQVGFPIPGPVLGNTLQAYARGFEISLQRRSANRLSGWVAYARNYSKYWQPNTTLSFPGDYDQRNTFSAYGAYRITRTIDLSGTTRYGSGFPIPGFLGASTLQASSPSNTSVIFQLSQQRNTQRSEPYLRSDVRINKVFIGKHYNLTVHGEIENLTGHVNYSYYQFLAPGNIATAHQMDARRESTLPFLPAAGLTLEF